MDANAPSNDPNAAADPEESFGLWLKQNTWNLIIGFGLLGLVLWKLHPLDVVLAAAGLTLIIFLHELGHFAAAKLCNVHVETFSIGFGPAIPFCKYKYGETTYKLAVIPLGGFVKMLGEGENAEGEEAEHNPRSFKNQSVPERMLIISAGVIMNMLLAMVLFVVVYMHGLPEQPAVVANIEPGGALWRQNVHTGAEIQSISGKTGLWFDDIRPIVWGTQTGDQLEIRIQENGVERTLLAEPLHEPGAPFPLLGFRPPDSLTLYNHPRDKSPPYRRGSAAERAKSASDGPGFLPGDIIVGMADGDAVTPFKNGDTFAWFEYEARLAKALGKPVTVNVKRMDGSEASINLPAEYRFETGLRMQMGPILAIRDGSPAMAGDASKHPVAGDRIVEVEIAGPDGQRTLFAAEATKAAERSKGEANLKVLPLDPLRLPWLLKRWALDAGEDAKVKVTVIRGVNHSDKRETFDLHWDRVGAKDLGEVGSAGTPVPVNGLGLAYQVLAVIDAVNIPESPLQPGDNIEAVKYHTIDDDGEPHVSGWEKVKPGQWAFVDRILQYQGPHKLEVKVNRNGTEITAMLEGKADETCPVQDRGLIFMPETRIQKAGSIGEALGMGVNRTVRMVKGMYINLYAMVFGRVSAVQTMSGPITLARLSYKIAGESSYKLLLLLALISINLAVVNFLPIPMLDGGHMMFLIYEGIVGKPPPERIYSILTYVGIAMVFSLMLFVIGLDLWRLAKMWFGL